MQQRRLRPGDVLDDYCPRERRVTDHAIVAMVDEKVHRTRCVVCDAEHEYKEARVPPQRRKKEPAGLFNQVLDGLQPRAARQPAAGSPAVAGEPAAEPDAAAPDDLPGMPEAPDAPQVAVAAAGRVPSDEAAPEAAEEPAVPASTEDGPFRRRLFRAQLPRHEGQQVPARAIPEFTIRQPGTGRGPGRPGQRPGGVRRRSGGFDPSGGGPPFGNRHGGRGQSGHSSYGHGQGHGQGQGQGQGRGRSGRGRRRRGGKKG
ncbi:MAG: hypothetical protein AB1635_12105 [Acidobacteriota bacterium]